MDIDGSRGDGGHEERGVDLRRQQSHGDAALVLLAQDVAHVVREERRDLGDHLAHPQQEEQLIVVQLGADEARHVAQDVHLGLTRVLACLVAFMALTLQMVFLRLLVYPQADRKGVDEGDGPGSGGGCPVELCPDGVLESVQQSHFGSPLAFQHLNLKIEMQIGAQMGRTVIPH